MGFNGILKGILGHIRSNSFRTELFLFLLFFAVFNMNLRMIDGADTVPSRYIALSIIKQGTPALDSYRDFLSQEYSFVYQEDSIPYFLQYSRGHYLSTFPIGAPLLSVPIFFLISLFFNIENPIVLGFCAKIAASFFSSLSAVVLYSALKRVTSGRNAIFISASYALATSVLSTASQALWQHPASILMLSLSIYFIVRSRDDLKFLPLTGFFSACSVLMRPTNLIVLGLVSLHAVIPFLRRKISFIAFIKFAAASLLPLIIFFSYNLYYFGKIFGGYGIHENSFSWSGPFFSTLAGLLLSPGRGLLIYTPFLIFAFYGIYISFRDNYKMGILFSLIVIGNLAAYSKLFYWWSGYSYGPRVLIDTLPFLCFLLAKPIEEIQTLKKQGMISGRVLAAVLISLVAVSAFIHLVGEFYYPCGWNEENDIDNNREKLWDISDTQIGYCVRNSFLPSMKLKFFYILGIES